MFWTLLASQISPGTTCLLSGLGYLASSFRAKHAKAHPGLSTSASASPSARDAEKAMAPHSSALAWKIPWMEEPGKLKSMRALGVRHH